MSQLVCRTCACASATVRVGRARCSAAYVRGVCVASPAPSQQPPPPPCLPGHHSLFLTPPEARTAHGACPERAPETAPERVAICPEAAHMSICGRDCDVQRARTEAIKHMAVQYLPFLHRRVPPPASRAPCPEPVTVGHNPDAHKHSEQTNRQTTHVRSAQERKQLPARHKVHHHVQVRRVLERPPQVDDERVLHGLQHCLLVARVRHLLRPHNLLLAQHFDRIEPPVVFASHCTSQSAVCAFIYTQHSTLLTEMDPSKAPRAQRPVDRKVGKPVRALGPPHLQRYLRHRYLRPHNRLGALLPLAPVADGRVLRRHGPPLLDRERRARRARRGGGRRGRG